MLQSEQKWHRPFDCVWTAFKIDLHRTFSFGIVARRQSEATSLAQG